jgi:tetratricopeptide (TPR) repeat protein
MQLSPSLSIRAYNAIGDVRREQGDLEGAAEAFRSAIQFQAETGIEHTMIASVHMNLGMLLRRMDEPGEARKHFAEAVKWFRVDLRQNPKSLVVWDWLGDTLAIMSDFKGASEAFEKTVALEPANPAHYRKLAKALEMQRRYDEAIAVVRKQIVVLKEQGQTDAARQMSQYVEILEYERVKQRH